MHTRNASLVSFQASIYSNRSAMRPATEAKDRVNMQTSSPAEGVGCQLTHPVSDRSTDKSSNGINVLLPVA